MGKRRPAFYSQTPLSLLSFVSLCHADSITIIPIHCTVPQVQPPFLRSYFPRAIRSRHGSWGIWSCRGKLQLQKIIMRRGRYESRKIEPAPCVCTYEANGYTERPSSANAAVVIFRPTIRRNEPGRLGGLHLPVEPISALPQERLGQ